MPVVEVGAVGAVKGVGAVESSTRVTRSTGHLGDVLGEVQAECRYRARPGAGKCGPRKRGPVSRPSSQIR